MSSRSRTGTGRIYMASLFFLFHSLKPVLQQYHRSKQWACDRRAVPWWNHAPLPLVARFVAVLGSGTATGMLLTMRLLCFVVCGYPTPAFLGSHMLRLEHSDKPCNRGLGRSWSLDACVSFHFCCSLSVHLFVIRAYVSYLPLSLENAELYLHKPEHLLCTKQASPNSLVLTCDFHIDSLRYSDTPITQLDRWCPHSAHIFMTPVPARSIYWRPRTLSHWWQTYLVAIVAITRFSQVFWNFLSLPRFALCFFNTDANVIWHLLNTEDTDHLRPTFIYEIQINYSILPTFHCSCFLCNLYPARRTPPCDQDGESVWLRFSQSLTFVKTT